MGGIERAKFREWKYNLFETVDCKKFLEDYLI